MPARRGYDGAMIRATTFADKKVAVFGLGSSGNATALSLIAGGAHVLAWDDGEASRAAAAKLGIPLVDLRSADWTGISSLVLAPGVPLTHPEPHWVVSKTREENERRQHTGGPKVEVIGDVEIFCRERAAHCPDAPFIAITGTNGKSTTTALITHLLKSLGIDVEMGGNIGRAILTLEPAAATRVHVVELSSFQIDLTPSLRPTVGVALNITPDHIDRHGTVEHYASVKERLVAAAEAACIGIDDDFTRAMAARIAPRRKLYAFTTGKDAVLVPQFYAAGSILFAQEDEGGHGAGHEIADLAGVGTLRGRHNVQNALAALAALRALQDRIDVHAAASLQTPRLHVWQAAKLPAALTSYPGLAHRMEQVGRIGKVLFINDSKATNADSTEKALLSWERGIHWILGGKPKEGGIEALASLFPRVAKAYLIGAASDEFAASLSGTVPFERCGTLANAVAAATRDAAASGEAEPVVLLSPACASYDQFKNFEERGDAFRKLVNELPRGCAPREAGDKQVGNGSAEQTRGCGVGNGSAEQK